MRTGDTDAGEYEALPRDAEAVMPATGRFKYHTKRGRA